MNGHPERLAIVIPVFNDWESVGTLLPALDGALSTRNLAAEVVLVDDCSETPVSGEVRGLTFRHLQIVKLIRLRRNLGHQRAIAVGLLSVHESRTGLRAIVVMDGDGEGKPEDVPRLIDELERHDGKYVIFAARAKRLEHPAFQMMYHLYRLVHLMLTEVSVRVWNFI